jgi:hypothetical protein
MALMHTYAHWNTTYHHAKAHDHTHKHTNAHRIPITHLAQAMLRPSIYIYIYEKEQWTFERVVIIGQRCVCLFACLLVCLCVCVRAHSVGTIFATTRGFRQLTRLIPIELHFAYSVFVARPPQKIKPELVWIGSCAFVLLVSISEQHFQPGSEMKGLSTVKKRARSSKVMKT